MSTTVTQARHTAVTPETQLCRRILVVDDSEFVRQALLVALRRNDQGEAIEVLSAANGQEALDILTSDDQVCVAVLDVGMRILNIPDVVRRARADRGADLFIVATGTGDQADSLQECLALGADRILRKPIDVESLRGLLRSALDPGKTR